MREFELIDWLRKHGPVSGRGVVLGIGDDAAVLELPAGMQLVAATDSLVGGVHFPPDTAPADLGHKALAVNLSDLAAMGASPRWCLLNLVLPDSSPDWLQEFCRGFRELADAHGAALVGGDTCGGPLSITVTVLGVIAPGAALTRAGARAGDLVAVSGPLGSAARALEGWRQGRPVGAWRAALDRPVPRVEFGRRLVGLASACIDISDGLLSDLAHIARASRCGAVIELSQLPATPELQGLPDSVRWPLQLAGGDDYELCFTLAAESWPSIQAAARECGLEPALIGRMVPEPGVVCRQADGGDYQPAVTGFEHFSEGSDRP